MAIFTLISTTRKISIAMKPYKCNECGKIIKPTEKYLRSYEITTNDSSRTHFAEHKIFCVDCGFCGELPEKTNWIEDYFNNKDIERIKKEYERDND